jgi:hypothetical protein
LPGSGRDLPLPKRSRHAILVSNSGESGECHKNLAI